LIFSEREKLRNFKNQMENDIDRPPTFVAAYARRKELSHSLLKGTQHHWPRQSWIISLRSWRSSVRPELPISLRLLRRLSGEFLIRRAIPVRFVLGARDGYAAPAIVNHDSPIRHAINPARHDARLASKPDFSFELI
jgi:hypothetical protein